MNGKKLVVLIAALALFAIVSGSAQAQMQRHGGFVSRGATASSRSVVRPGTVTSSGRNWHGDWHHRNRVIFVSSFGFPFWGVGYPYGYGYGYYPYGGYPYCGGGYYGGGYYGGGYYGGGYYGNDYYGGGYSNAGYARYSNGSGYGNQSSVARLQQRLARAGYYRGPIDGIMGPRTRYALRAYQHDHGTRTYGMTGQ